MADKPNFGNEHKDDEWGCIHVEVTSNTNPKIHLCHVNISDLKKMALELSMSVIDSSWIMDMDEGARRSYNKTALETANSLVEVFNAAIDEESVSGVSGEFGELIVSMGSSRSLEVIFQHISLPIAELWKPQRKQNEGFDFHTVCNKSVINFGEAKFKSVPAASPVSDAADQANSFFSEEKHFRDRVHLVNLVHVDAIANLDQELFGMVIAFSMNAKNPLTIYKNAISKVESLSLFNKINSVYIVGVSHGN
ncbi:MAG: hypothetical protein B7Y40_01800 [Gammaproteobacteria bacterium 28-57-27]|nr:MAG: hypothetical protein B7Y40_01800 [Gammaproteobacteria bacterium 28-57-27]